VTACALARESETVKASVLVPESPSKADASAIDRAGVSGFRISMERGLWATPPLLSETWRVKANRPSCAGCPEIVPAVPSRPRPGGRAPSARLQKRGVFPPSAESAAEYAVRSRPSGSALVVIESGLAVEVWISAV
jgi:hypothetical protein